jgi:hypothetical protein
MILDSALNRRHNSTLPRKRVKELLRYAYNSKRFVFEPSASRKLAKFSRLSPDVVCANAMFALPPFPNTYIELDNLAAIDALSPYLVDASIITDPDTPKRLAYFFCEDGCIYVITGDDKDAMFTPFVYANVDHNEFGFKDFWIKPQADFVYEGKVLIGRDEHYERFKLYLMTGVDPLTPHPERDELDLIMKPLTDLYDVGLTSENKPRLTNDIFTAMVEECAGGLRWAIAALTLLNMQRHVTITEHRAGRKLVRGKHFAIPAHNVVTIDLDADDKTFRQVLSTTPTGIHQRRHEVSGHWVHYNVASQCQHEWVQFHSEEARVRDMETHGFELTRYICAHCGGRKTRKPKFEKGDIRLGRVQKDYKVIASKEEKEERKRGPFKLWPSGTGDTE